MNLLPQFAEGSWDCWRMILLPFSWHSSAQEGLRGSFQQEVGKLEQEVAALRRELASLKLDQEVMGKHVEGMLEQLKAVRADVSPQSPPCLAEGGVRDPALGLSSVPTISGGSAVPSVGQPVPVATPAGRCHQPCPPAGRFASGAPGPGAQDPGQSSGGPEAVGTGCSGRHWSGPAARGDRRGDRGGEIWPEPQGHGGGHRHGVGSSEGGLAQVPGRWLSHRDSPYRWDIDPELTSHLTRASLKLLHPFSATRVYWAVPAPCPGRGCRWQYLRSCEALAVLKSKFLLMHLSPRSGAGASKVPTG